MQSVCAATTVRVGNHSLTAEEVAAGVPQRLPFVEKVDGVNVPVDPDVVRLRIITAAGTTYSFRYPAAGPTDDGVLATEETGRFYVDWTPGYTEDGLVQWFLEAGQTLGTGQSDQDVFSVRVPPPPVAAAA
jgi:hypothetical protein